MHYYRVSGIILALLLGTSIIVWGQKEPTYRVACIGFYNLENLFDTINDPLTNDEEFLPDKANAWTDKRFREKLDNMAHVVSLLGTEITPDGAAIMGFSEIENRYVLEELIKTKHLKHRKYEIVHFDSPDYRGVDVGLIYQPRYFTVLNSKSHELVFTDAPDFKTRDQLVVTGILDGDTIHIIVNHWPSRRGGTERSEPRRVAAAQLTRAIADSLIDIYKNARIVVMGDLNDNPTDASVKKYLRVDGETDDLQPESLYNPFEPLFRKGIGTTAYRDVWNLFDMIIISESLVNAESNKYKLLKPVIFSKDFLIQQEGRYKGYPLRTFGSGIYLGGYSDHFPVYLFLAKQLD
ncbi:MAG: endonuclease/exonuclease/phosphatase family protein [Bacteroidetes bacterium]|nr:endonuclease/exonuclease/phosphatase family protein [Bacteroidota bacterium]